MSGEEPPRASPLIQSGAMDTAEQMQQTQQVQTIQLSTAAAGKVKELLQQEGQPDVVLRVAVQPGGCSGLRYQMFLDDNLAETDVISEQHGVRVAVDRMSAPYLKEAKVDFVDTLEASGFTIDNPAAQSSCACGNSFH
jgi:iron-sulfur cluster assembly accessory protein